MEPSIKIFIISLKPSVERRTEMTRLMEMYGYEYEFFEAVNGNNLNDELLDEIREQPYSFRKAFGRDMTKGEIGCAMSHLNIYNRIVSEKIKLALILEDDIEFDGRLFDVIHSMKTVEALIKLELVLLGYSADGYHYKREAEVSFFNKISIKNKISFCIPTSWNWSTIGYLISYSGAAKLLKPGILPRFPADFLTANSPKYGVRLAVANRPVIWPGELNKLSHIGGGRGHKEELNKISISSKDKNIELRSFPKKVYSFIRYNYRQIKTRIKKITAKFSLKPYRYISEKF